MDVVLSSDEQRCSSAIIQVNKLHEASPHQQMNRPYCLGIKDKKFMNYLRSKYPENTVERAANNQGELRSQGVSRKATAGTSRISVSPKINCRIVSIIPIVEGDNHDEIDNCEYIQLKPSNIEAEAIQSVLLRTPNFAAPHQANHTNSSITDQVKPQSRLKRMDTNKYSRKSVDVTEIKRLPSKQSVYSSKTMNHDNKRSSSLKKKGTISVGGNSKKKVSFNTQKTVFRYTPVR